VHERRREKKADDEHDAAKKRSRSKHPECRSTRPPELYIERLERPTGLLASPRTRRLPRRGHAEPRRLHVVATGPNGGGVARMPKLAHGTQGQSPRAMSYLLF
jgi:hypothetical protein